jgi:23S rRNA pseudouridine1911/1915/1917 synthase
VADLTFRASRADRLDRLIATELSVSRARVREALEQGTVWVDGRRGRKGDQVAPGAELRVQLPEEPGAPVPQPELPLEIVHEDASLIAVSKPAGWPSHPMRAGELGTLANAVAARHPECASAGAAPREGGLCQRLDRETSGVILVARTPEAYRAVREQLSQGTVEKLYWALVSGEAPEEGFSTAPVIQKHGRSGPTVALARAGELRSARPARTFYRSLGFAGGTSLLEVRIETGVRHQIRVHLSALGLPLTGDVAYGGGAPPPGLDRYLLHAARLVLVHPATGEPLRVAAPLPADALRCLADLGLPTPETSG